MIVGIEDDVMDPVMQCTTSSTAFEFLSKETCSFVTEIHVQDKKTVLQPHSSEVGFINHMLILKLSNQGDDRKITISRSQSQKIMAKKSKDHNAWRIKAIKNKTRKPEQGNAINVKRHFFMSSGGTEEFEEETASLGEIVSLNYY
ncbi:hypothetical protein Tco_0218218 [Tanacetum coccineum]